MPLKLKITLYFGMFCVFALVACGGGSGGGGNGILPSGGSITVTTPSPSPTPIPTPAGATDSVATAVSASTGGTVSLKNGSAVTFGVNAVSSDAVVQVAYIPAASPAATTGNFTALEPALQVQLFPSGAPTTRSTVLSSSSRVKRHLTDSAPASMTIQFKVPSDVAATISGDLNGFVIPVLKIYSSASASNFIVVASPMKFDPSTGIITAILQGPLNVGQLIQIFVEELGGNQLQCMSPGRFQPGLRYYDPSAKQWTTSAPPTVPVHPLILLHGVLSCVESTFNPGLVERIREDGGYDAVYGYDYDWLKLPADVVPGINRAFEGIGFQHVDIMAHSYGSIMAMAMIPQLNTQTVDNLVLIEGPLNGSLLDDPQLMMSTVAVWPNLIGLAEGAVFGAGSFAFPVTSIFVPNNSALQTIESQMMSASDAPSHVIKIAGNISLKPLPDIYQTIYHKPIPTGDGVMTVDSALFLEVKGTQSTSTYSRIDAATPQIQPFAATHTSLLGDSNNWSFLEGSAIAPNLSFELNDADPNTGFYPNSGGEIIMKGIDTRSYIGYVDGNAGSTINSTVLGGTFLTIEPNPQDTEPYAFAGPYQKYKVKFNPIANLGNSPNEVVGVELHDAIGGITPNKYTDNFFILPLCSSCNTAVGSSSFRLVQGMRQTKFTRRTGGFLTTPSYRRR